MNTKVTQNINDGKNKNKKIEGFNTLSDPTLMEMEDFSIEYILKLSKAAMIAGGIPDDDSIVPFIGEGFECDNCKAIQSWIRSHINALVEVAPKNQIEWIIEEIDNRLQEVKTGYISCK